MNNTRTNLRLLLAIIFISIGKISQAQTVLADAIPASYNVSETGAFTYSVPLRLPPGLKGLMPNLAISYNSQGGNSTLGMGWALSGLSSVTRTGPTLFHNNELAAVNFGPSDNYVLDGQRLIATGNGTYATEIKNFSEISSAGQIGNAPSSFTVVDINGVVYEYGYTLDSRMIAQGRSDVLIWALNKVYDRAGNYMQFEYTNDFINGNYRIEKILYSGNSVAAVSPPTEVKFNYQARPDVNKTWVSGSLIRDNVILDNIEIRQKGNLINLYNFTYEHETGAFDHYSRLVRIDEIRPNNVTLPPVIINWGKKDIGYPVQNTTVVPVAGGSLPIPSTNQGYSAAGDINGDGMTDVIRMPAVITTSAFTIETFLNDNNHGFTSSGSLNIPFTFNDPNNKNAAMVMAKSQKMFLDYNGDGYEDMILRIDDRSKSSDPRVVVQLYLSDGTKLNYTSNLFDFTSIYGSWPQHVWIVPGDYDGDGRKEIIIMEPGQMNGTGVTSYNVNMYGEKYPGGQGLMLFATATSGASANVFSMDYDGDGKDEFCRTTDPVTSPQGVSFEVYKINAIYTPDTDPTNAFYDPNPIVQSWPTVQTWGMSLFYGGNYPDNHHYRVYPGDFNGDGKDDLLTWDPWNWNNPMNYGQQGNWELSYSKGSPGTQGGIEQNWLPGSIAHPEMWNAGPALPNYGYIVQDFNGDGKDDILQMMVNAPNNAYKLYLSNGLDFVIQTGNWPFATATARDFMVGDFNGDGQADVMGSLNIGGGQWAYHHVYFRQNEIKNKVTSVVQDNYRLEVEHLPLPQDADYVNEPSFPGGTYTYSAPFFQQAPLQVVKTIKDGLSIDNTYNYGTLTFSHLLGMLGFQKTFVFDNLDAKVVETQYYKRRFTQNISTRVWDLATFNSIVNGTLQPYPMTSPISIREISNNNYDVTLASKIMLVLPASDWKFNYSNGTQDAISYSYDHLNSSFPTHGQPKSVTSDASRGTKHFTYDLNAPHYNRFKPTEVTIDYAYGVSRTTQYQYNNEGHIGVEIEDPGLQVKTTTYSYDDFGNITNSLLVATGVPTPIKNDFEYSPDGRFLTKTKNTLLYTEEFTYNDWGGKLTHKGINGFTSEFEYDAVNRVTKSTDLSTGISATTQYDWATSLASDMPSYEPSRFVTSNYLSGIQGVTSVYYNYYGKVLRKTGTAFDGQTTYQDVKYKPSGMLDYTTDVYYKNNAIMAVKTEFTYDDLNRETKRSTQGGATINTTYNYGPNPGPFPGPGSYIGKTVNNPATGLARTIETNTYGNITRVNEVGTSPSSQIVLDYEYGPGQELTKIRSWDVSSGQTYIIEYSYDPYGRLAWKEEPNAGKTIYVYTSLGQVRRETDASGKTYQFQYDVLGRLVQKTGPDGAYNFGYENNTGVNNVGIAQTGLLLTESSPYNTTMSYSYDLLGRMDHSKQLSGGKTFEVFYTYDNHGRKEHHTYPSGDVVKYNYNQYGYFESVEYVAGSHNLPAQKLWQIDNKNAHGKNINSTYYENGSSSSALYNMGRVYDQQGYLTSQQLNNVPGNSIAASMLYQFDAQTGNLSWRLDGVRGLQEDFTYDSYDRLTDIQYNGGTNFQTTYDVRGNIRGKTDASTTTYPWKYDKYALTMTQEPQTTGTIPLATQEVAYHPFKKVKTITEYLNPTKEVTFTYSPSEQRTTAEFYDAGTLVKTKHYAHNYEQTDYGIGTQPEEISFIWGDGELVAFISHKSSGSQIYYTATDYLGSITHILDNNSGAPNNGVAEERSFDAWGRQRNPNTWLHYTTASPAPSWMIDRGYTCHEHLNDFNVINMNGRLYDPLVGRMFTPDPLVADNTNSQTLNKYSYCNNNPLKFTDPSGKIPILIPIVIGAAVGAIMGSEMARANDVRGGAAMRYVLGGALVGAAAGAVGATAGGAVAGIVAKTGFWAGAAAGGAGGFAGGFVNGFGMAAVQGGDFDNMATAGFMGGFKGAVTGAAVGGVIGGINAAIQGKDFFSGEYSGSYLKKLGIDLTGERVTNDAEFVKKAFGERMDAAGAKYGGVNDKAVEGNQGICKPDISPSKPTTSTIYVRSNTLNSDKTLFYTVDHELCHAEWYHSSTFSDIWKAESYDIAYWRSEVHAYTQSLRTAKAIGAHSLDARDGLKMANKALEALLK